MRQINEYELGKLEIYSGLEKDHKSRFPTKSTNKQKFVKSINQFHEIFS